MNNLIFGWPELIVVALLFVKLGGGVASAIMKAEKGEIANTTAVGNVIADLLWVAMWLWLLYLGGFFA